MAYLPEAGDLVWVNFDLQAGREQARNRPAPVMLDP
jgi:mRNA interferase MazF